MHVACRRRPGLDVEQRPVFPQDRQRVVERLEVLTLRHHPQVAHHEGRRHVRVPAGAIVLLRA